MTHGQSHESERGFTLVELMMALVIFSVAVAGILSVAVSLTQGFREQRQAIQAQDAVRAPLDMIADAVRQVSPGVQNPNQVYDTNSCKTGAISVSNSTTGSDTLDIIYASGGVVAATSADMTATSVTLTAAGNFAAGDYVLITDFSTGHVFKLNASTTTTTLAWNTLTTCTPTAQPVPAYTAGALVVRVQHALFYAAPDSSNGNMPTLWMDPDGNSATVDAEPLAEGIEDLQVAVGIDADNNLTITDAASNTDEWRFNAAGDVAPTTSDTIRAVRLTLIARTTREQLGDQNSYTLPTAEDRTTASANDRYRRRVLKQIVDIRNATGSP